MNSRPVAGRLAGVTAIALIAPCAPAMAQSGPTPPAEEAVVGEVIVTAQKRSERLQDVPLAVTALGAETLEAAQVSGTAGIAALVPSLTFAQNTSPLNNNVRVRGVGTALFSAGIESSVSFVVDGVVLARQGQGFIDLIDVERVEVLLGPQGTLFGKNATAGVINVVTKAPAESFEGSVDLLAAELGEYRLRGTVSGPLSESVRARLTGFYTDDAGWATNTVGNRDVFGTKDYGLRAKFAIDAGPNLGLTVIGDYTQSDSTCCQPLPFRQDNTLLRQLRAPVVGSIDNRLVNTTTDTFADFTSGGLSVEANLALDNHTLTSITAWRQWDFTNNVDVDGFNVAAPVRVPFGSGFLGINGGTVDIAQVSQELRLTSASGGAIEYTVGAMYFDLDLDRAFTRRVAGCPTETTVPLGGVCVAPRFQSSAMVSNTQTENLGLFGQLTWNLTDRLSAIGGARIQRETTSYSGNRPGTAPFAGDAIQFPASTGGQSITDNDVSGKLGLQYKFSRHAQVYGTWSRGYKGIGWDVELSADFASQRPVLPETVKSWEIGFKGQALDNRLSMTLAAFHAEYTNLQVQATQLINANPVSIPTNAGSSVSKGIEFEASYEPADGLTFNGGVSYLRARFDSDGLPCQLATQTAAITVPPGAVPPGNTCFILAGARVQNVRDGVLPNAPEWKANLAARYERQISSNFTGFVQVNGTYHSKMLFDLSQDPAFDQPSYATVDLSVGFKQADGKYQVSFFVRNLGDEQFTLGKQRDPLLSNPANAGNIFFFTSKAANRYFGGTLRVNF